MTDTTDKRFGARWIGTLLLFLACMVSYLDRSNFAVSIPTLLKALEMTPVQMGIVTTVFSIGYGLLQIPAALMARKYGPRFTMAAALFMWSIFTLLTGFAGGFVSLLFIRFFFGMAESPLFVTVNTFNVKWFPVGERALANGIPTAGAYLAPVVTPPLTVWILTNFGWQWVFILSSVVGFVIMAIWYMWARDNPEEHSGVSPEELAHIQTGRDIVPTKNVPWKAFFSSRSFWCIGVEYFCALYFVQFFLYWLPFYLQKQLNMTLQSMGYAAAMPWIFVSISVILVGRLSDTLIRLNYSRYIARNVLMAIGFAVSAVLIYSTVYVSDPWTVVWIMSFALGFAGFTSVLPLALASDVGGELTGVVYGWMNTWGFAGAAVMPTVVALIGSYFGWNYSLLSLIAASIIGIVATLLIETDKKLEARI